MKTLKSHVIVLTLAVYASFSYSALSQVGIGTLTPDASSMLDITSTTGGMLTPRMTSAQRTAIVSPAEGLLVFDIDEGVFYFYDSTAWLPLESAEKRNNFKLIKSVADLSAELAAGGGAKYLLSSNTLYEINGTITLAQPIELNNAYLIGLDTNEDILVKIGGTMFTGNTGGSIKNLTLTAPGGTIFNLTGTTTQNLIFRDSVVANSASVGSISGYGLAFLSIIQFSGNTTGISYNNITDLLLSNLGWLSTNSGTFETFTGTFNIIEKQGGFSEVDGVAIGIDVSSNPIIGNGVLTGTSFSGTSTQYINGYTVGSYIGYNFNNAWTVNCPGIPVESDNTATGDINLNYAVGTGALTSFSGTGAGSRIKLAGNTTSNNLFRFNSAANNRITYNGLQKRYFNINTSMSFLGTNNNAIFIFYIAKNGTVVDNTRVYREIGGNNDVGAVAVVGSLELDPGDYIEVWAERFSGTGELLTVSLNLTAK